MTHARKPLRVCHVAYSFYESDNRVIRYAEALAARGDQVDVIGLRGDGAQRRTTSNGVAVLAIQKRARNETAAWTYLVKILWFFLQTFVLLGVRSIRKPYDVVHVHNIPDFLVFVALVPKIRGARIILDIHDVVPELYCGRFRRSQTAILFRALVIVERLSCAFADHVVVANDLWLPLLQSRSLGNTRSTVLLNYPDESLFRSEPRPSRTGDPFVLVYPGSLSHHQGLDIAIRAFATARGAVPDAKLVICGDGPARDSLQRIARDLCEPGQIEFLARKPISEIPSLLRAADVGIVPKRADGFGDNAFSTKVLEFMAAGLPVILARTSIDEHYFDDSVVRFFTPGDAGHLADQIQWAYHHRSDLSAMAQRASEYVSRFSWRRHQSSYIGIIDGTTDT